MKEFRILGPLEALDQATPVALAGRRQQSVLATLIVSANHLVSTDQLVDAVWGAAPPPAVLKTLRAYTSRLRALLGAETLAATPGGYLLQIPDGALDAAVFEAQAAHARAAIADGRLDAGARGLREALALFRGPVLHGLLDNAVLAAHAARLEGLRLAALEDCLAAEVAVGRHADVATELEALVEQHPLRERLWEVLVLALYRDGRQADALAACRRVRSILAEELGIDPRQALQDLERAVLRHEVEPAAASPRAPRVNLPAAMTSFVGRGAELDRLADLVERHRLVTILGAGGIGKTRLALECVRRISSQSGRDALLVELASVRETEHVAAAVADTLSLKDVSGRAPMDVVADALRARDVLLVIDNCEHVIKACATLAGHLLQACPDVRIVATSRAPLRLAAEATFELTPMPFPDHASPAWRPELIAGYDAVRLFRDRAAAVRDGAAQGPKDLANTVTICRALDGMPLAIELAAARARTLTLTEIVERLGDRLALLRSDLRDAPARHQTLRAAIDWSHDLLGPDEQAMFRRISVFVGAFDLEAAARVCDLGDDTARSVLERLVTASVVRAELHERAARYRLFETLREYGAAQLEAAGETDETRCRHAAALMEFAERAAPGFYGPEEARWFAEVDARQDDLRLALSWSLDRGLDEGPRIAAALGRYWWLRGKVDEGDRWLARALAAQPGASALRAELLLESSWMATRQTDLDRAQRMATEALELARRAGATVTVGRSLHSLAFIQRIQGRFDAAASLLEEAIVAHAAAGNVHGHAVSLGTIADIAVFQGRYERAAELYPKGLSMLRELGVASGIVAYLHSMAELAFARGDLEGALQLANEALPMAAEIGEEWHLALLDIVFAHVARERGEPALARTHVASALRRFVPMRDLNGIAHSLEALGGLELDAGHAVRAAGLLAAAERARQECGVPMDAWLLARHTDDVARTRAALGDGFDAAWAAGATAPDPLRLADGVV